MQKQPLECKPHAPRPQNPRLCSRTHRARLGLIHKPRHNNPPDLANDAYIPPSHNNNNDDKFIFLINNSSSTTT